MARPRREFDDEITAKILRLRDKGWTIEQLRVKFKCGKPAIERVLHLPIRPEIDTNCFECGAAAHNQVYRLEAAVWELVTIPKTRDRRLCLKCLDDGLRRRRGHGLQLIDFFPCAETSAYLDCWRPRLKQLPDYDGIIES